MDDACVTAPRLLRKLMGSSTVYCDICNTHQAMDYDTLRLFLHLSRTLHFLRTSRACHVSPSALSRAVQRLERETGWPLFERDRRSVRLTPEGARFAAHAR
jgi:Mn-dependent DtxR family transcriptional regulator